MDHHVGERAQSVGADAKEPLRVILASGTNPGVTPNTDGLPGLEQIKSVVGALSTWGLVACVAAVFVGAGLMAFGRLSSRPGASDGGKTTLLAATGGAVLIGGANAIVAFFAALGSQI